MAGMLTEAQGAISPAQPSSGPVSQTPPPADPGAGNSSSGGAAGPGQPEMTDQPFEVLRDEAIQLVYGDRFDQMIKMFQTNGAEKFPRSMGVAINTAITELEKKNGTIPPEMAAELGMDLMMKLLEDIIAGGVVPDVKLEQVQEVLPAVLVMYGNSHPNVSKEEIQAVAQEVQGGLEAQGGGGAQPAGSGQGPPAAAGAAAPPPAMVPPPGGPM